MVVPQTLPRCHLIPDLRTGGEARERRGRSLPTIQRSAGRTPNIATAAIHKDRQLDLAARSDASADNAHFGK